MAVSNGEANALNRVLRWVSGVNPYDQPEPSFDDIVGDLELLLAPAYKKLMAGFAPHQAEQLVTATAARLQPKAEDPLPAPTARINDVSVTGYARRFGWRDSAIPRAEEHAVGLVGEGDVTGRATAYHVIEVGPFTYRTRETDEAGTIWVVNSRTLDELGAAEEEVQVLTTKGLDADEISEGT